MSTAATQIYARPMRRMSCGYGGQGSSPGGALPDAPSVQGRSDARRSPHRERRAPCVGQQLMAVTYVEGHVEKLLPITFGREVECLHLVAVMRDPPGAAALRGADLDGERRPDLSQEALDCRSLAGRHLPIVIGERVHGGPYDL